MDKQIHWYRSPIDKELLKELTQRSDFKGLVHMSAFIAMSLLTGTAALFLFYNGSLWAFAAVLYLHWTLFQFFGRVSASHELCHYTVFKSRRFNRFFYALFTFFAWENRVYFRARHMSHHRFTADNDRDAELELPFIITPARWTALFTFDFFKFVDQIELNFNLALGVFDRPVARLFPESDQDSRRAVVRCARELLMGHAALAVLFIVTGLWPLILIVTLAPFFAQWLNMLVAFPQHVGLQPRTDDFRKNSRTYDLNPALSFLYCNMQYHIEHHMYAAVPFYNLPKLRKALQKDLPPSGGGLLSVWRGIFAIWKKQQHDPDYFEPVELPAASSGGA
jgi:fatty acid desaturase